MKYGRQSNLNSTQLKEAVEVLKKQNPQIFKQRELSQSVENILKIQINGPSAAEFFAGASFIKNLENGKLYTPGSKVQLKTDASVTFSYTPIDFSAFLNNSAAVKLKNQITNWGENFLNEYKRLGKGKIDVSAADKAYRNMMQETLNAVQEVTKGMDNEFEEKRKILEQLSNYVNASISVKEYVYGNNEMGFSGGSLGPSATLAIKNIVDMYTLGGLSVIDAEDLMFAVANCGVDAVGHSLKPALENYLLGGAAMLMFDDGFATTEHYIEQMKAQFEGFAPKSLHLYVVQGRYVPASLVYTSIHQALEQAYFDIKKVEVDSFDVKNKVTINNPITETKHKPHYEDVPYAQDRFNQVWGIATDSETINIKFAFLAGLLDIFEAIPKAFSNI